MKYKLGFYFSQSPIEFDICQQFNCPTESTIAGAPSVRLFQYEQQQCEQYKHNATARGNALHDAAK